MNKICNECGENKDYDEEFYALNKSKCKKCIGKTQQQRRQETPELYLLGGARQRAKAKDFEFSITLVDVTIPDTCPVLGIELEMGNEDRDTSPSIDRIDNNKGYTPDNVRIISYRANRLKSNATPEELEAVIKYMRSPFLNRSHPSRGHGNSGENSPHSKLHEADVREMRRLYAAGWTHKSLAVKFDVGKSVVGRILRREKWKHVE